MNQDGLIFMLEIISMILVMVAILGSLYIKMILLPDIESHHEQIRKLTAANTHLEARVKVLEKRAMNREPVDKVVITHEYAPDKDAPNYGGF